MITSAKFCINWNKKKTGTLANTFNLNLFYHRSVNCMQILSWRRHLLTYRSVHIKFFVLGLFDASLIIYRSLWIVFIVSFRGNIQLPNRCCSTKLTYTGFLLGYNKKKITVQLNFMRKLMIHKLKLFRPFRTLYQFSESCLFGSDITASYNWNQSTGILLFWSHMLCWVALALEKLKSGNTPADNVCHCLHVCHSNYEHEYNLLWYLFVYIIDKRTAVFHAVRRVTECGNQTRMSIYCCQ